MRKPTTATINSFIRSRYVLEDAVGPFVPGTEVSRAMAELMQAFEGIYCGVVPDKKIGRMFFVRSMKSERCFAQFRVKDAETKP